MFLLHPWAASAVFVSAAIITTKPVETGIFISEIYSAMLVPLVYIGGKHGEAKDNLLAVCRRARESAICARKCVGVLRQLESV